MTLSRAFCLALTACLVAGAAVRVDAGVADTPLPTFADGKPAQLAVLLPAVVKDNNLRTYVVCTNLGATPVDVGLEVFDQGGVRGNTVAAGNGADGRHARGASRDPGAAGDGARPGERPRRHDGPAGGVYRLRGRSPASDPGSAALRGAPSEHHRAAGSARLHAGGLRRRRPVHGGRLRSRRSLHAHRGRRRDAVRRRQRLYHGGGLLRRSVYR